MLDGAAEVELDDEALVAELRPRTSSRWRAGATRSTRVTAAHGVPRNRVYALALDL